jgi:hypothetical protein
MSTGSKVLTKMLDRLLAGLMSGPNMNCRPHNSRQRVDLAALAKLQDIPPEQILLDLLGTEKCAKAIARVKLPKKSHAETDEETKSPAEKAWIEQSALISKLRVITDDARTYENDTGVHALSIGFPILSLPPGTFGGASRSSKRILAPIAFIPVSLSLKAGTSPSVELACRNGGADRVVPNTALLSWIEQQTGKPPKAELFDDEEGVDPWREITELAKHVADAMHLPAPDFSPFSGRPNGAPDSSAQKESNPAENPAPGPVLQSPPRGDDESDQPAILFSAVLGLFPTTHQGLLRDTRAMIEAPLPLVGPIQNFLSSGIDFDAPAPAASPEQNHLPNVSSRTINSERLAAAADPCQARAVALARQAAGLVVHGPPGTGKSQTITNIIADHLARGQRVLLVCEKRTALDVVADRLEHLGLRSLCGIVHDPQRDQRDLYRNIHQQLDDLPEAKTNARAENALEKIDAELQQLHDELTRFHKSLMQPPAGDGASFHELMGRLLAEQTGNELPLKPDLSAGVALSDLEQCRPVLVDLFHRAQAVKLSHNPWAKCAGISLSDYLARPMTEVRTQMDRVVAAAEKADGSVDPRIPPFNVITPLSEQSKARTELFEQLTTLLPRVADAGLLKWAGAGKSDFKRVLPVEAFRAWLEEMKQTPLDAELLSKAPLPTTAQLNDDFAKVTAYLNVAGSIRGFFSFRIKSEAKPIFRRYGLDLNAVNAKRMHQFTTALTSRLRIATLRENDLTESTSALATLPPDDVLEEWVHTCDQWFSLLERFNHQPALAGVYPALAKAAANPQFLDDLLEGLRLSATRAEAVIQLEDQLTASRLFDAGWQKGFAADLRGGKLSIDTASALNAQLDSLEGVLRIRVSRAAVLPALSPVVDSLLAQAADPDLAVSTLSVAALSNEITKRLRADSVLQAFDAPRIENDFNRYRQLDGQKKILVRDVILNFWISRQKQRLLNTTGSRLNATGADLRRRLTSRGERAMRLRQVIAVGDTIEGGDPLFDLCPVWMASPETVAQIFPRKAVFDVIVFDEASQCRLEEALPVLTRGRRVVIAGDPNQLPPTRFFESGLVQSEDEDPQNEQELFESQQGEIEDLLAAALNLAIQQCYLDVHYRSRNADLIEFSNRNFYASRLQAIPGHPSNRAKFSPLTLYRVEGVYNKRQNEAEADRVVQIVHDLLKRADPPSIGIACLNLPQRDLIVEKLDDLANEDPAFARRLATARLRKGQGSFEGLFVKNLENVQGDERDHIIISTTYGPDAKGKFYRRFGPLGMTGGGRRLNVLVTRARCEVHLVSSIPVEAYRNLPAIPEGQSATGAWLLFAYLKYAEELLGAYEKTGVEHPTSNVENPGEGAIVNVLPSRSPSLFARKLGDALATSAKIGSDVFWGNAGFCVDLALHDPATAGEVCIGLLCDGCRYDAADDVVEWDIFRTGILTSQGWTLRRIWTPHFFRDPAGNLRQIKQAVDEFSAGKQRAGHAIATERI